MYISVQRKQFWNDHGDNTLVFLKVNIFYNKTTLNNIWQTVTNAGVLNKQATQSYENLNVSFTTPNETSDGLFAFADISVEFNNYGNFQLMFIVDGIESPLSSVITVTSKKEEIKQINVVFYLFKH